MGGAAKNLLLGGLSAWLMAACATPPPLKAYPGTGRAPGEIALLKSNPMIGEITDTGSVITSVNGQKVPFPTPSVEVLPGTHQLQVQCSLRIERFLMGERIEPGTLMGKIIKQERLPLEVTVQAGHTYRIDAVLQDYERCKLVVMDISQR